MPPTNLITPVFTAGIHIDSNRKMFGIEVFEFQQLG